MLRRESFGVDTCRGRAGGSARTSGPPPGSSARGRTATRAGNLEVQPPPGPGDAPAVGLPPETTAELLSRARAGDERALNRLFERVRPALWRIAHHRIPARIRALTDTDDLVQETLLAAFKHVGEFERRGEGAFLAYLRRILLNRITDELRRVRRRPEGEPPADEIPDAGCTPLDLAVGRDVVEAYEAALESLPEDQRLAVILRVDFGLSHQEVAGLLGRSSWNAARMLVVRGLLKVAEHMKDVR